MQAMMDLAIPNAKHTFESLFGVSPIVCMDVWTICVFREGTTPMHVLRALLFLKVTDEEVYLPIIANCTVESFEKWLPPTIKAIGDGCTHVVSSVFVLFSRSKKETSHRYPLVDSLDRQARNRTL